MNDIDDLLAQLEANARDAQELVRGLSEEDGVRPRADGGWSVSECLDHLATADRVYIDAMREPAARARAAGKLRKGPAMPGWIGRWFVRSLEPSSKRRLTAPRKIRPRTAPALADAFDAFMTWHASAAEFLRANADLDLATIRFPNPFIPGVRFSLATGLNVIAAHERRHLQQAWRTRRA